MQMNPAPWIVLCALMTLSSFAQETLTFTEMGHLAMQSGDYKNAITHYEKALTAALKVLKEEDLQVVVRHAELGDAYRAAGRWAEAIQQLDYSWKRARYDAETHHRWRGREGDMAVEYAEKVGRACLGASRYADAAMVFAFMIQDGAKSGRDETELLQPCALLADTLLLLRRDDEADQFIQQAVQIAERRHANNASVRTGVYSGLANLYILHRMFPKARPLAERALEVAKSRTEPAASTIATLQTTLGGILVQLGDAEAAEALLNEARSFFSEKFASEHDGIISVLRNLSAVSLLKMKPVDALASAQEAVRLCKIHYAKNDPELAKCLAQLAACYAALKENAMASTTYAQAIEIAEKTIGVDNPQTAEMRTAREHLTAK